MKTYFISCSIHQRREDGFYEQLPVVFYDRFVTRREGETLMETKTRTAEYIRSLVADSLGVNPTSLYVHVTAFNFVEETDDA